MPANSHDLTWSCVIGSVEIDSNQFCFITCVILWVSPPREICPLTKVIPLKLFLGIVPSSSADITRALRGQPKWLSRNYGRRNGGDVIVYVLISFHRKDVLCPPSRLFVLPGFRLFCPLFAVHYLAVHSILGSLIWQSLTATSTIQCCVSVSYDYFFISLPLFTKSRKTTTWKGHVLYIRKNVNCARTIFKIYFMKLDAVLNILFGIFLTV